VTSLTLTKKLISDASSGHTYTVVTKNYSVQCFIFFSYCSTIDGLTIKES